jgi:tungstate transport system substrate-binding protein
MFFGGKKFLFSLFLIALTVLTLVTGCSSSPATTTTTSVPKPANPDLILASTTSVRDTGLMDTLIPMFEQQTGYKVKPVYVGSGAALKMGQEGNADVLVVHSPAAEVTFMSNNYGINRKLIMGGNDFIIVGKPADPAGIKGMTSGTDALQKIADAKAKFYSRGDASGTDALEKSLWKKIGITVADNSTTNPPWYIQGGAGTGMLDLLRVVSEKGDYAITDAATYLTNQKQLDLVIMVQGDKAMLNFYHVIEVNPDKWPKVNTAGAKAFSDFLLSAQGQKAIADFGKEKFGKSLFIPYAGKSEAELGTQ